MRLKSTVYLITYLNFIGLLLFVGCQPKQEKKTKVKPEETLKNLHIMSTDNNKWKLDVSSVHKLNGAYHLNLISLQSKQTKLFAEHGTSKELTEFEFFDLKGHHKKTVLEMERVYFLSKDNLLKGKNLHLKSKFWELEAKSISSYYPLKRLRLERVKGTYKR